MMDRTTAGTEQERHERAVSRTLEFADEAASRRDYADALAWLQTLEAIGQELPAAYRAKRTTWQLAHDGQPSAAPPGLA